VLRLQTRDYPMASRSGRAGRPATNSQDSLDMSQLLPDDNQMDRMELMFVRLSKIITDSFNTCVAKLMSSLEEKLSLRMDVQTSEIFTLNQRLDKLEKKLEELAVANTVLQSQIHDLNQRNQQLQSVVESLEQYTRSDSILLHGLPLPQNQPEDLYRSIPEALNSLIPSVQLTSD
jgi:cell division protein FtsB